MLRAHRAIVDGGSEPLPGMRLLWLHAPALAQAARPGQFVMVRCGGSFDPYLRRALAIHRLLSEGCALLYQPGDAALGWLAERRVGETVDLLGPGGRGFDLPRDPQALVLLAQGRRLAPLLSIVDRADCAVQLVTTVATAAQVYPRELLPRHVEYQPHVGASQNAAFWRTAEAACAWGQRIYAAGADAFYRRLQRLLRGAVRPPPAQAWVQRELLCGTGACGGCLMPTREGPRAVCSDGPAFDLAALPQSSEIAQ